MATARKLPSGKYRCMVYTGKDATGKRQYRSFTAPTKKEAEFLATDFIMHKKEHSLYECTIDEAINMYIESKINVLSPASIRGYKQMRSYFTPIANVRLSDIEQKTITNWVNQLAQKHAPKTVCNAHGLLTAVLNEYAPEIRLRTKLPQKKALTYDLPSDEDIRKIIAYLSEHDNDLLIAVYLAAFGTLRRSEICALHSSDVFDSSVHVCKAMVLDPDKNWVIKTPKTASSDRYVQLPDFVIASLPKTGPIVNLTPSVVTLRFRKALERAGIKHFRFHDLRHYAASVMHALGVPDQYIMKQGGWATDNVLKTIYRGTLEDYQKQFTQKINAHFETMQHEMQHEK